MYGIRISIEGLEETNNKIRGLEDGFNKGYSTLKKLVEMKHPDVRLWNDSARCKCKRLSCII